MSADILMDMTDLKIKKWQLKDGYNRPKNQCQYSDENREVIRSPLNDTKLWDFKQMLLLEQCCQKAI